MSDRKVSANRYGGVETPRHYRLPYLLGVENTGKVWKFLVAIKVLVSLPRAFFCHPAEQVAPELIGCLLVKAGGSG